MKRRLIEALWDCNYCGTKAVGGSKRECPNCGHPRDEEVKFYLPETRKYVEEEKASKINRNPDWICKYCNTLNSDDYENCESCGAPRESDNLNYFQNQSQRDEDLNESDEIIKSEQNSAYEMLHSSESQYNREVSVEDEKENVAITMLKNSGTFIKKNSKKILIGLAAGILLIGLIFLLIPKEIDITVESVSWERTIEVERFQTVNESDWNLPVGARLHYAQDEIYGYEPVLDHYETRTKMVPKERFSGYEEYSAGINDLGNGYYEEIILTRPAYETYYEEETYQKAIYRDEPVYKTKYYYEIDKWLWERNVVTSGFDKEPYWGEPNLKDDERTSTHKENYFIIGKENGKGDTKRFIVSYDEWNQISTGDTIRLQVTLGNFGKVVEY